MSGRERECTALLNRIFYISDASAARSRQPNPGDLYSFLLHLSNDSLDKSALVHSLLGAPTSGARSALRRSDVPNPRPT